MTISIGAPLNRVDGRLKVTGGARYAAEEQVQNVAYGVLVQSAIGKGRVLDIDARAAEAAPGVLLVLTMRNMPKLPGIKNGKPGEAYPLLQDDSVRYNGQHIGLVVAESFEQAVHAATLLAVRYDEERPIARLEEARDKAAVPKNFRDGARPPDTRRGDPASTFAAAPVKVDETYMSPVEYHNPLEPHAVIATWEGDRLTLYHSTQGVFPSRKTVAGLLGLPPDNVHVVSHYVGGGFGTKGQTWPHV